jgi:4a-hydroxytetrahydrobiopterin dehydratase
MKPSSVSQKPLSRAKARNAALLNQLATPGLGSILCGRWIAGLGQLILSVLGCVMIIVWMVREVSAEISIADSMNDTASPDQQGPKLLIYGSIFFVVSWFWSLVTSLSLMRQVPDKNAEALKNFSAPPQLKMDAAQIALALGPLPDWQRNGEVISRTFRFKDFPAAMKFVNAVADAAEEAWHHPDIDIRWNKVTLALTTHSAGGLTEKDFALARKADGLARG